MWYAGRMDPFALVFYATICGLLSVAGPRLGRAPVRLLIGAGVGILAAALLPLVKALLG